MPNEDSSKTIIEDRILLVESSEESGSQENDEEAVCPSYAVEKTAASSGLAVEKDEATNDKDEATNGKDEIPARLGDYMCLFGAYLFFRLPFLFMLPMVEAPDEFAHYWVIKFLRENMRLPNAHEVASGGASAVYGSLPQLGYIPHVLCSFTLPPEMLALSERFGSLLMGQVMLFSAFSIGTILFPKNRLAALALPAAIVVHPQLSFIQAYANNDSTSSALASLLLWMSFETVSKGLRFDRTLWMGVLTGWLAITKYSGLAVIPVVGLALIGSLFLNGTGIALAASSIIAAAGLALAVSVWWFLQNNAQYPGDFMGTKTMYKSWALTFHRDLDYYLPVSHIIKDHRWWRMTFFSYWGLFGYMNKYLWKPVYWIFGGFMVASLLGFLTAIPAMLRQKEAPIETSPGAPPSRRHRILIWSCLALCFVINISMMIAASVKNLGGPQGRYLITSEIPIMALIIGGLNLFHGKTLNLAGRQCKLSNILIVLFLAYNAIICIGSWIYLFRLYGGWHLDPLL